MPTHFHIHYTHKSEVHYQHTSLQNKLATFNCPKSTAAVSLRQDLYGTVTTVVLLHPLVCVLNFLGGLALWQLQLQTNKMSSQQQTWIGPTAAKISHHYCMVSKWTCQWEGVPLATWCNEWIYRMGGGLASYLQVSIRIKKIRQIIPASSRLMLLATSQVARLFAHKALPCSKETFVWQQARKQIGECVNAQATDLPTIIFNLLASSFSPTWNGSRKRRRIKVFFVSFSPLFFCTPVTLLWILEVPSAVGLCQSRSLENGG